MQSFEHGGESLRGERKRFGRNIEIEEYLEDKEVEYSEDKGKEVRD